MAAPESPIGSRRRLGAELRRLRNRSGLTLDDVAAQMTCSTSKISRLETGKGIPKVPDVSELMRIYGVDSDDERDLLLGLVHDGRKHGWWEPLTEGVAPERFVMDVPGRYAALENDATTVRSFDVTFIHGLLQTPAYARAVLATVLPHHGKAEIDRLVELRMVRQEALRRTDSAPLELVSVIDEAALQRSVGSSELMIDQLEQLREMAGLPHVQVHVLPYDAGLLRAHGGHFVLLEIPRNLGSDVVYIESHAGETFLDESAHVDLYREVFAEAVVNALPVDESRAVIDRYLRAHVSSSAV